MKTFRPHRETQHQYIAGAGILGRVEAPSIRANVSLNKLIARVDQQRGGNLSSALRLLRAKSRENRAFHDGRADLISQFRPTAAA